jgi:hypothetical protein
MPELLIPSEDDQRGEPEGKRWKWIGAATLCLAESTGGSKAIVYVGSAQNLHIALGTITSGEHPICKYIAGIYDRNPLSVVWVSYLEKETREAAMVTRNYLLKKYDFLFNKKNDLRHDDWCRAADGERLQVA